jgi:hypothetical protein
VEQEAGNEKVVGEPSATYGSDDQAGDDEYRAQYRNTTIGRFANVREDGFGPSSLLFPSFVFHLLASRLTMSKNYLNTV